LPAAAEHDSKVGVTRDNNATDCRAERRIVDGILRVRSQVDHFVPSTCKVFGYGHLQ